MQQSVEGQKQRLQIVVTDDNRANRRLARKILEKRSHVVEEAASGAEVLEMLKDRRFDVVLMDVQMPEMDGLETSLAIRQLGDVVAQPYIVALTAHAMQGDRERCLAAGMDAYIAKPLASEAIVGACRCAWRIHSPPQTSRLRRGRRRSCWQRYDFSAALERLEGDHDLLVGTNDFFSGRLSHSRA